MKINLLNNTNNIFNNISFQKQLVAKCAVLNQDKSKPCLIYSLDKEEREDYLFDKIKSERKWDNSWLAHTAFLCSDKVDLPTYLYVIEDKNKCLGFVLSYSHFKDTNEVHLLEVRDDVSSENEKRTTKYTGQSLLAFLAALSKKQGGSEIDIITPVTKAIDFYKKGCLFKKDFNKTYLYLKKEDFDKLIKLNEQKTGKRVELVV